MKSIIIFLLICLFSFNNVTKGDLVLDIEASNANFSEVNGTFSFGKDGSVDSGVNQNLTITSNHTNILIVVEEMLLQQNDNITIINIVNESNKIIGFYQGFQAPFSLFVNSNEILINIKTSSNAVKRTFKGFYNTKDCSYILNKDSGFMSAPMIYSHTPNVNCIFELQPSSTSYSKRSITFLNTLNSQKVNVTGSGLQDKTYSGSEIPPEIIGKDVNTDLKLNFTLEGGKERVNFTYENVEDESEYVKFSKNQTVKDFNFKSDVTSVYQPETPPCHWVIETENKNTLSVKFTNVSVSKGAHIIVNNGNNHLSEPLKQISSLDSSSIDGTYIFSSGNAMVISLLPSDGKIDLNAQVKSHSQGGYLQDKGDVLISKSTEDTIYLLEVKNEENVVVETTSGKFSTNSSLYIYNDFSVKSKLLLVVKDLPNYPIVSDTSRMMIIAKNFDNDAAAYKGNFQGISKGCYKMATESSYDYVINVCQKECKWIVTPDNSYDTISLHMHLFHFDEKKEIVTINLLDKSQTKVFDVNSNQTIPELYLPAKIGFIMITKCISGPLLHVNYEKLNGCNKVEELSPGKELHITSPNYPNSYPILAQCWSNITSNNSGKNLFHVAFEKLSLSPIHCLNFNNKNGTLETFSGNHVTLPNDMLFQPDLSIEFVSKPCNITGKINLETAQGFSLNVTSADCGGKVIGKKGNFSTPNYPNTTTSAYCIWLLEVPQNDDIKHPNIINFTVTIKDRNQLKIYDGGSIRDNLFQNISTVMLSRKNKLLFVYKGNGSQSSKGLFVKYQSQTCVMTCQNGICLHPDWVCNHINDCGDNTDELNCTGKPQPTVPTPTESPKTNHGVSAVALWLGLPIAFILGILAAMFVPPLYRRFRSSQYHQFRDISAEA